MPVENEYKSMGELIQENKELKQLEKLMLERIEIWENLVPKTYTQVIAEFKQVLEDAKI